MRGNRARTCLMALAVLLGAQSAASFAIGPAARSAARGVLASRVRAAARVPASAVRLGGLPQKSGRLHSCVALRMSVGDDAGGFGTKNITVGPTGINYEDVGAVGNLRMAGKGFKTPEKKRGADVGVNFGVKPKSASGIDQNTAQEKKGRSDYDFANLVEFPCLFQMKVLGYRQGEFVEDILDLIGNTLGIDGRGLKHSHRDKGKWRSITIAVPVESADQLYKVYEAVDSDPRVKYKF